MTTIFRSIFRLASFAFVCAIGIVMVFGELQYRRALYIRTLMSVTTDGTTAHWQLSPYAYLDLYNNLHALVALDAMIASFHRASDPSSVRRLIAEHPFQIVAMAALLLVASVAGASVGVLCSGARRVLRNVDRSSRHRVRLISPAIIAASQQSLILGSLLGVPLWWITVERDLAVWQPSGRMVPL